MLYRTDDLARWGAGTGVNLAPVEIDTNFWELAERLVAVEATAGSAANGIASIAVTGSQMTVWLDDGTALGPYTLPTAMIRYRGDWTAATAYVEMDLVTVPGTGVYLVLREHTSDATFDALAEDAEGNPLYRFLFPMGTGRPSVSDEAVTVLATPTDLNFAGDGVSVADDGDGTATVTIPGGGAAAFSDEGVQILAGPSAVNFVGDGVAVADDGDGTVTVTIPGGSGAGVSDEGVQVLAAPTDVNFAGAGVAVADDGDGTVTVTIPGGGATGVSDEGVQILAGPSDLNFAGAGVSVADDGDGSATVTIPGGSGAAVSDEGVQVLAAPTDINFAGAGVAVADDGDGTVTVTIGGGSAGALGDLSDVALAAPAAADFLRFDGAAWVDAPVAWADIPDTPATFAPSAHTHPATDIAGAVVETIDVASYTQVAADHRKWKRTTSASAVAITIDANVNVAEDEITFQQGGAGQITFAAGAGMTLTSSGSFTSAGPGAVVGIKFLSATEAVLFGHTTGAAAGDMLAAIYDPTSIAADAFARANHTGEQGIATVTGLQTALDGKAAASHTHPISEVTGLATALAGKNAVINGNFDIWQRGASFTASGYTADRWRVQTGTGATSTVTRQSFTPGQTDVPGEPEFYLRYDRSVAATANSTVLFHRIEGVQTLAGQEVTISFYAKAAAAYTLSADFAQVFGAGGSASVGHHIGSVDFTTSWQKFTFTTTVPSISGKTIGDNSFLQFAFNDATLGTFTIDVAQVQLELGSVATAFEKRPLAQEFALCQRYYQATDYMVIIRLSANATFNGTQALHHRCDMRVAPTAAFTKVGGTVALTTGDIVAGITAARIVMWGGANFSAVGDNLQYSLTLDAEL